MTRLTPDEFREKLELKRREGMVKKEKPKSKTRFKTFEAFSMERLGDKIQEWFDTTGSVLIQITHAVEKSEYSKTYTAIVVYEKEEVEKKPIRSLNGKAIKLK